MLDTAAAVSRRTVPSFAYCLPACRSLSLASPWVRQRPTDRNIDHHGESSSGQFSTSPVASFLFCPTALVATVYQLRHRWISKCRRQETLAVSSRVLVSAIAELSCSVFTARCSAERCCAIGLRQSVRLAVCLLVTLVCSTHIFLFYENNYTKIKLGFSLPGGKEAPICSKKIILKFQVECCG